MRLFNQADQRFPDHGVLPEPYTWNYALRVRKKDGYYACQSDKDLALCTCANRHTTRLTSTKHKVGADGTVSPSYVCTVGGCGFHEFIRLVGWDGAHVYRVEQLNV